MCLLRLFHQEQKFVAIIAQLIPSKAKGTETTFSKWYC